MNPTRDEDKLERVLDGALRDLAPRRAPPTLESRVLADIARRHTSTVALRSFRHWPLVARAAFLATSFALIGLVVMSGPWMSSWFALADTAAATWLEVILAAAAFLYATLFGLGAAAYRLLYLPAPRGPNFGEPQALVKP